MVLRKLLYIGTALLLAGCSSDESLGDGTLSGNGKTPLQIEATLSTDHAVTRAAGKQFEPNDQLLTYIRHITGDTPGSYTSVDVGNSQAPKFVTLTKGSASMTGGAQTLSTTDLSPIYWDDFSLSSSADTDLRTEGHGLQSFYGYCYNGGTPSTPLTESTGVLGWTIATNQSTAEAFRHNDLLWSPEQEKVTYAHGTAAASGHGTMTIPYTHAMSEVTVTINASDGFVGSTNPLSNTVLTLYGMKTTTTVTAPTSNIVTTDATADIIMYGATPTNSGLSRVYTAIVAPGTKLKVDEKLLDITNADGNNYEVMITSDMVPNSNTAWSYNHTINTDNDTKNYIETKTGYNYHLTVTLKKAKVEVIATITDWTDVTATGNADINFSNDVVSLSVSGGNFTNNSKFSLFRVKHDEAHDTPAERTNDSYEFATISTYATSTSKWTNAPTIYWPNGSDNYYFRALAQFNGANDITNVGTIIPLDKGTAVSQDGHDILWGTTAAHTGNPGSQSFTKGQAIPPRTGDVPIAFEHAMSKVTFTLETVAGDPSSVNSAAVDLNGATIAISNLYTSGTINIEDGTITPTSPTVAAIAATTSISNLIVVPQTIGNTSIVTITLSDNTVYKLQLNQCVVSGGSTPIKDWQQGKNYTYTIHLEKELITFSVRVKDWDAVSGSGPANLEWD